MVVFRPPQGRPHLNITARDKRPPYCILTYLYSANEFACVNADGFLFRFRHCQRPAGFFCMAETARWGTAF
jgi:hypothetical protein